MSELLRHPPLLVHSIPGDSFDPYFFRAERWAPSGFRFEVKGEDGRAFRSPSLGLTVIVSGAVEADGKPWVHLSLARKSRIPSYDDMSLVRRLFLGEDVKSIQVFPKKEQYVNLNPYVLHLFVCLALEGDGLPEFSGTIAGVRTI